MTTTRIEVPSEKQLSPAKNKEKPRKVFQKDEEKEKVPLCAPTPFDVFQNTLLETDELSSPKISFRSIDELITTLCDTVHHCVSNGIEETTLILHEGQGEITLKKYDTAPMQFTVTFSLTEQASHFITPSLPELSKRLSDQFQDIEFTFNAQHLATRREEKQYRVQGIHGR